VADAAVVMGTQSNKAILKSSGLMIPGFDQAGDTDLLVAAKAGSPAAAEKALAAVDELLKKATKSTTTGEQANPVNLSGALNVLPGSNLALISVAGRYAGDLAMLALENNLHVMLFSDNVPLEQEIKLKKFARSRGLLVMGRIAARRSLMACRSPSRTLSNVGTLASSPQRAPASRKSVASLPTPGPAFRRPSGPVGAM